LKIESRVMPALLTRISIVAFRGVRLEPLLAHRREPLLLAVVFGQATGNDRVAQAPKATTDRGADSAHAAGYEHHAFRRYAGLGILFLDSLHQLDRHFVVLSEL